MEKRRTQKIPTERHRATPTDLDDAKKQPAVEENRGDGTDSGGNGIDDRDDRPQPSGLPSQPSQGGYGHRSSRRGHTTPVGSGRNQPGTEPR
ncbi:MAG: hypothetical protein IT184_12520 [Acidobacteria bacterium]|nr:hypothetical protein [Acidobacteriota bacterium]